MKINGSTRLRGLVWDDLYFNPDFIGGLPIAIGMVEPLRGSGRNICFKNLN